MMNTIRYIFLIALFFLVVRAAYPQSKAVRTGSHAFTIQWITFNSSKPGQVMIKPQSNGIYSIEGGEWTKKRDEYVTIKGTFKVSGQKLLFDGQIVSRVSYINKGEPCSRNGHYEFRTTGTRKYWRLQQMLNCDGETTDYIDIFF